MFYNLFYMTMLSFQPGDSGHLLQNKDDFYWYFEGAGIAHIEEVGTMPDGSVYTRYLYFSGSEKRTGINTMKHTGEKNLFSGSWVTNSENGDHFEGNLTLTFAIDGTARGYWTWTGVPGQWKIELRKRSAENEKSL